MEPDNVEQPPAPSPPNEPIEETDVLSEADVKAGPPALITTVTNNNRCAEQSRQKK
ncbi:hypothetical protein K469DRAFT_767232, partial [Zopfia rhizophila CBS 207.26]